MIFIGLLIAPLAIVLLLKVQTKPLKAQTIKNETQSVLPESTVTNHTVGPTINPEQLMPESGNTATFLVNKFLETVPQPTPDCKAIACVALTFDDGPNNDSTAKILASLEQNFSHATFFEIGKKIAGNEALLKRMQLDGDDIGNHSWSHQSFLKLTAKQMKQQVEDTQKAITESGVSASHLFRPPYGDFKRAMEKDIKLPIILWNVDPKDWAYKDPNKIALTVEKQIKPGAIIVLHDKPSTAAAVNKIIIDLKSRYRFVTVTELLNLRSNSQGAYIGR